MSNKLTLRKLKNTGFPGLYKTFMINPDQKNKKELVSILSIAIVLINLDDEVLQHLGYRIIVEYCNRSRNYHPLYEVAVNYGLYPVSKFIEEHYIAEQDRNIFTYWNDAYTELYKQGDVFLTDQQYALSSFFANNQDVTVSIVAPTSYGKSELIIKAVEEFKNRRICVITSTKALLMQTKRRIKDAGIVDGTKIIVHPEMYNIQASSCVAVLTQERLLRLFKMDPTLSFDCVVVDEAHEILEDNLRSNTLASVVIVAKKRNPNVAFKFLTPFVSDSKNLQPRYVEMDLSSFKVNEYIKTEEYFAHDIRNGRGTFFYDQFMDEFWKIPGYNTPEYEEELVATKAARKNIVYLNKPVDIEDFSRALADVLPGIDSREVDTAIENISEYLQPQYNLLACLRKGVIYHHGSVPDAIRIYIEDLYKRIPEIKFVVTTSTLLSGVNLPAERMFILDNKKGKGKLRPEAFKNLIGRVCRFSEIFNPSTGGLEMLEPQIHIVFGKYFSANANYMSFIQEVAKADIRIEDKVDNILLENTRVTPENEGELKAAAEFIENYENGVINNYSERYTTTEIGQSCIMNGIREIDVFANETKMQSVVERYKTSGKKIDNADELMFMIQNCFIDFLPEKGFDDIRRLNNSEACRFYAMMIDWQTDNKSYAEMISLFIQYWRRLYQNNKDAYVYVGRWGKEDIAGSHNTPYVYLKNLNRNQAVNLAIVRIKEEKDFIDNTLIRFVEVFNDLDLIDESFYTKVKYGTDNPEAICLLKNGLSLSLALLLIDSYKQYLKINIKDSEVYFQSDLIDAMEKADENRILIYEVKNCM